MLLLQLEEFRRYVVVTKEKKKRQARNWFGFIPDVHILGQVWPRLGLSDSNGVTGRFHPAPAGAVPSQQVRYLSRHASWHAQRERPGVDLGPENSLCFDALKDVHP